MMPEKTITEKQSKEAEQNIYEKVLDIKKKLLGIKKTGENKFSNYTYFELGDILNVLTPALHEKRLFMKTIFSATEQKASLVIFSIDNINEKIEFETWLAECNLKGMHAIQNMGAVQTYIRRYLIMTAFDIADTDILDGGAKKEEQPYREKSQRPQQKSNQAQEKPHENEIEILKRESWELIKVLPVEEQQKWIDSCKGANITTLKEIIQDVKDCIRIDAETQQNENPKETKVTINNEELDIF